MYEDLEPYVVSKDYRKYNLIDPVIKPENMSLEDIDMTIINSYKSFYMHKLHEVLNLESEFKKKYMLHSMKLIMSCSFITDKIGSFGEMPPEVAAAIDHISSAHKG